MKTKNLLMISLISALGIATFSTESIASARSIKYKNAINVDGELSDREEEQEDADVQAYKQELKNLRKLHRGYIKKTKLLGKMKRKAEQLTEKYGEFLGEQQEYDGNIAVYNKMVKCATNPKQTGCDEVLGQKKKEEKKAEAAPKQAVKQISVTTATYPQAVRKLISQNYYQITNCYQRELNTGKSLEAGRAVFILSIKQNGSVDHVGIESLLEFGNKNVIRCVARVLRHISFPQTPSGMPIKIRQPLQFRPHMVSRN